MPQPSSFRSQGSTRGPTLEIQRVSGNGDKLPFNVWGHVTGQEEGKKQCCDPGLKSSS